MNWGKGIVTGMVLFMLFISGMCIRMFMAPADEYDHQYYEKGLNFDADYKKERQVLTDNALPRITQGDKSIRVKFIAQAKGTIKFIRPSNQRLDTTFIINSDEKGSSIIVYDKLAPGNWQIVLNWSSNGKAYLYQQEIYLQ